MKEWIETIDPFLHLRGLCCHTRGMPDEATTEVLRRKERVVHAVVETARESGLVVAQPRVLHDAFSVVVHLAPSPVVARVPVVLPAGFAREDLLRRQRRELAVVEWLAGRGEPVVVPSPLFPREPLERDGLSMTFWTFVEVDPNATPDYLAGAGAAAPLHVALRDYPGELPFLSPVNAVVPRALDFLREHRHLIQAADLERALREWELLAPLLSSSAAFESAFPNAVLQPIHGDAPSYNMIHTPAGGLYADFEDVTLGPREWDLALFGPDAVATYDAAAAGLGLPPLDAEVQRILDAARSLQVVACLGLVPELPALAAGIAPMLDLWRASAPLQVPSGVQC